MPRHASADASDAFFWARLGMPRHMPMHYWSPPVPDQVGLSWLPVAKNAFCSWRGPGEVEWTQFALFIASSGFSPLENRFLGLPEAKLLARRVCVGLCAFLGFVGGLLACFCKPLIAIGSCGPSWAVWLCSLHGLALLFLGFVVEESASPSQGRVTLQLSWLGVPSKAVGMWLG